MKINYYIENMISELVCLAGVSIYLVLECGFGYQVALLLLIDFFFLKITKSSKLVVTYFSNYIANKIANYIIAIFLRINLSTFFVLSYEVLSTLNTCKYDLVLRCLFTFIPFFIMYHYAQDCAKSNSRFLYLSFFLNVVEITFFFSTALFFVFGFFKLLFAKYALVIVIISMILILISVRLVPDYVSVNEAKNNEKKIKY